MDIKVIKKLIIHSVHNVPPSLRTLISSIETRPRKMPFLLRKRKTGAHPSSYSKAVREGYFCCCCSHMLKVISIKSPSATPLSSTFHHQNRQLDLSEHPNPQAKAQALEYVCGPGEAIWIP